MVKIKKLKDKIKQVLILTILLITINCIAINADVGSFDTYDSGSDWGSSSSSWDIDYDDDSWSASRKWDSDYSSGSDVDLLSIIWLFSSPSGRKLLIIIIIVVGVTSVIKTKTRYPNNHSPFYTSNNASSNANRKYSTFATKVYTTNVHDVPQTHIYADKIKQIDPLFSEEKFLAWAKDLYVKLQHAWTDRNWEEMRPFETEELFEQHFAQIQGYIRSNTINVVDRISVNYATIYNFKQTEEKDIVEVALKATKQDYVIDATTKELVEGNKYQYRVTVYKMTFERTKGMLTTEATEELDAKNCPNCGAPLDMTSAGKCDYCGSIVTTGNHDWVLSNLEPLRK